MITRAITFLKDLTQRNFFGYSSYPAEMDYRLFRAGENIPFITPSIALSLPSLYRATTLISNDIAKCPFYFKNPNLEQIFIRPNRYQSGYDLIRSMTLQTLLYGNSFALINRRGDGSIYEIIPLPIGSISLDLTGKKPKYVSTTLGQLDTEKILHLKAPFIEGLWGLSPVHLCKVAISIGSYQEEQYAEGLVNSGDPKLAFIHPGSCNAEARQHMIDEYLKNHRGKENSGKPVILSDNIRIEKLSSTASGSEIKDARTYSIQDISRIYGVPTSYLSETQGSVYGSLEFLTRMYKDSCLSHWIQVWKSEIELKLDERPQVDTDNISRPSFNETLSGLRTAIEAGLMTKNEAREVLDLPIVEGGDEFFTALNLGAGGGTSNIGNDTSNKEDQIK